MLERIKYSLLRSIHSGRMRIAVIAVLCAAMVGVTALLGVSVKTICIFDGENMFQIRSLTGDVTLALNSAQLRSDRYRITGINRDRNVTSVSISYTFPVYITVGDRTETVETAVATVGEILTAAGYMPDAYDMIEPSVDTQITETAYIDYTDIDYVSGSYTEAIPCGTEVVYAADRAVGTETLEAGSDGVQKVSYTAKIVNGVTVETTIDGTEVLAAAVNAKQIIGTKQEAVLTNADVSSISTLTPASPIQLDANGVPLHYSRHITVQATAYTYSGNNCSTGVAPQPGYIAVNPNYIPYGTRMYIKSSDGQIVYGYAVAADTGGFIKRKPTNVDLFFPTLSACYSFGVRNVEIYILD